ncbi:MAG: hypothetical protein PHE78_00815 [Candidatus Gastranaerophilales bacterium]|nr:hypothetical protein [Candidatus Gastranaerophilales bacterium]
MKKLLIAALCLTCIAQSAYSANYKVKDKYGRTIEKRVETKSGYKSYDKYNRYEGKTEVKNGEIREYDKYGRRK